MRKILLSAMVLAAIAAGNTATAHADAYAELGPNSTRRFSMRHMYGLLASLVNGAVFGGSAGATSPLPSLKGNG